MALQESPETQYALVTSLTPTGERRGGIRHSQHLAVNCSVSSGWWPGLGAPPRFRAEVCNMTETGFGLRVDGFRDGEDTPDLRGCFLRMDVLLPGISKPLCVTGEVRWTRPDSSDHAHSVELGVEFFDPPPALTNIVADILSAGKGDQQFLWSLWESYARNP